MQACSVTVALAYLIGRYGWALVSFPARIAAGFDFLILSNGQLLLSVIPNTTLFIEHELNTMNIVLEISPATRIRNAI
jgi:hypothetical protein